MTRRESLFEIITALPQAETIARHVLRRGDILLERGSASDEMFFVLAGRFVVRIDDSVVGYIEAGSVVGELNFFTGQPRSATVEALRDAVVLRVGRGDYEEMTRAAPELKDAVAAELAARVAGLNRVLVHAGAEKPLPRAIAVIPAGDRPDVREVAQRLASRLGRLEPSELLVRPDAPSSIAEHGFDTVEAIAWFSAREVGRRVLVYAADPEDDDWNAAILRQVDHVLLVGNAGPVPRISALEREAFETVDIEDRTLVLLHDTRSNRVSGTPDWRSSRAVGRHHHVCLADDADLDRVARFLTGKAVGLVCSGGGALGPAQVGIWSAFREAGVVFDIFVGTSVGSAVAAAVSLGLDRYEFERRTEEIFVRSRAFRRPTVPRYALLDHTAFDRELRTHFGETDLQDLWMPFYAVASNLSRRAVEVISTGKLWEAVRASSSIPGMLPPFIAPNGDVLADGGATANVPIEQMRGLKRGPNLIVSVERERIAPFDGPQRFPGRGELLYGLVNPRRADRFPKGVGLTTTLVQAMIIGQASHRQDVLPSEIMIEPPIPPEFTFMTWSKHRELLAHAEEFAREWLRQNPDAPDVLMSRNG